MQKLYKYLQIDIKGCLSSRSVNNKLISCSINSLSLVGYPEVICFFAPVIILIVQRIGTQESNIFNNVTIENELEWRLNDNNIYTVRSRHTHKSKYRNQPLWREIYL